MNLTEALVWSRLRGRQIDGWKFRRQQPIGPYVVDFYCPAARLVVEVDGLAHDHDAQWAYDERRQAWLESEGYRVHRINVEDISRDFDQALDGIFGALLEQEALGFTPRPRRPAPPAALGAATSPHGGEELG